MARPTLQPVERLRLTDQAHAAIRSSIVSGAFAMGERLVEMELANELRMSRAPIREALQRLAKEGLVEDRAHQGACVAVMTPEDVIDLYNLRLGLETTALRLFMKAGASTGPLRARIAEMERAANRNDRAAVVRGELEFHHEISASCGNKLLNALFEDLEGRITMALALDDASFENLHDIAQEHVPVVEAIERGDPQAAVAVFEEHMLSTVGQLVRRLGGDPYALLSASARRRSSAGARSTSRRRRG